MSNAVFEILNSSSFGSHGDGKEAEDLFLESKETSELSNVQF